MEEGNEWSFLRLRRPTVLSHARMRSTWFDVGCQRRREESLPPPERIIGPSMEEHQPKVLPFHPQQLACTSSKPMYTRLEGIPVRA